MHASILQPASKGQVLTCSHTRSPFLYAIALFQPSGYLQDADFLPTFVVQPGGEFKTHAIRKGVLTPMYALSTLVG